MGKNPDGYKPKVDGENHTDGMKRMVGNIHNAISHLPKPDTATPMPKVAAPRTERQIAFDEKIAEMIESARYLVHTAPEMARFQRARYDAYINEGFTPEQALALIK